MTNRLSGIFASAQDRPRTIRPGTGGETPMSRHGLVAWIEPKGSHYVAAFVSAQTRWFRDPATRLFSAVEEARRWVEQEAAALGGVPVIWSQPNPRCLNLDGAV